MSSLGTEVANLLAGWGVAPVDTSSDVRAALTAAAADCGVHTVDIAVRWGRATVTAVPADAARLRWHADVLTETARTASNGDVTEVRVRTGTPTSGTATPQPAPTPEGDR